MSNTSNNDKLYKNMLDSQLSKLPENKNTENELPIYVMVSKNGWPGQTQYPQNNIKAEPIKFKLNSQIDFSAYQEDSKYKNK